MVPHCMTVLNLLLTQTSLILVYGGYLSSILQHTNTYGPDKQLDKCSNAWLEKWLSDLNGVQLSIYYKCLILTWTCSSHAKSTGALMWNAAPDKMTVWNTAHNTFFKKQASKDAAYAIFKTFLKHQQTKIPFFVPLQFQAVIHEPVCIAVIHFVLAFLHSVKFKWNELGARAAVSLCRKYAIRFCYTSVLQCVLSLPYLQCATSLHLLTSLHRVHMLTWVGQNLGNES